MAGEARSRSAEELWSIRYDYGLFRHLTGRCAVGHHVAAGRRNVGLFRSLQNDVERENVIFWKNFHLSWAKNFTKQSPWVETVPQWKQWQAAWAKGASNRKPQAEFVPSDSPWERSCSNSGTLPCTTIFFWFHSNALLADLFSNKWNTLPQSRGILSLGVIQKWRQPGCRGGVGKSWRPNIGGRA